MAHRSRLNKEKKTNKEGKTKFLKEVNNNMYGVRTIVTEDIDSLLYTQMRNIQTFGIESHPRPDTSLSKTTEVLNSMSVLTRPVNGITKNKKRKLNYSLVVAEFLSYVCGWGNLKEHAKLMTDIAPNYKRFLNVEKQTFDGAYGMRIGNSFHNIVELLLRDPDSRQAVVPIFWHMDSWHAMRADSLDIPCTCTLQFRIVDQLLNLTVYMRSNDIFWGTPYDVAAFTLIQRYVACWLRGRGLAVELGSYTHIANSLHVYDSTQKEAEEAYKFAPGNPMLGDPKNFGFETVDLIDIPLESHEWSMDTIHLFVHILEMACSFYECESGTEKTAYLETTDKVYEHSPLYSALFRGITGRMKVK